jgi:hypothetical protein
MPAVFRECIRIGQRECPQSKVFAHRHRVQRYARGAAHSATLMCQRACAMSHLPLPPLLKTVSPACHRGTPSRLCVWGWCAAHVVQRSACGVVRSARYMREQGANAHTLPIAHTLHTVPSASWHRARARWATRRPARHQCGYGPFTARALPSHGRTSSQCRSSAS